MYADDAGTRKEWLECWCSRWIHEDCTDDDEFDTEQCINVRFVKTLVLFRAGGMSSQLVRPNLTMRTMKLNAWVADNFMNIEIFFYLLYYIYNVITIKC